MRGHNPFLERHGDGWRFRVRFPSRLAGFLKRGDLRLHLGRIDRREAHRRARLMRSDADNLFVALGTMMDVRKAQEAIQEWKRGWAAKFASQLLADGRMFISAEEASSKAADTFSLDLLLRSGLQIDVEHLEGSIGRALAGFADEQRELEPVVQAGLRAAGITGETPSNVRALLTAAVLKAYGEMQRQVAAVGRGDASIAADILQSDCAASEAEARAELTAASNPVAAAATSGLLSAVSGAGASEPSRPYMADLGFSQTWERFVEDKIDITREWKPSRRPELAGTSRVWSWIVGPKSPSLIAKADLAQFRSVFLQLPAGYSRKPDYADTAATDTVKAAQAVDRKYERVSVKTFNKHLSTLKAYFGWLKNQGLRFGNYQRAMKFFPGAEGGFHRFRHTFITRLENTEAKTSFVEELTGHESRVSNGPQSCPPIGVQC